MSRPRLSRFLPSFVLLLGAALAGCSSLPPLPERTASTAMTGTADTGLGALAAASLEQAGPGESGFRLLPTGDFAFDARLALARRAERSLDAQYYQLAKDSVGLQFLRELRDAAERGVRVRLLVDDLYTGSEDELFCSFATIPNVEVRLFNPLPSRGGSSSPHHLVAARVQPHQPEDAQQAVHRRQPLLGLRRPQHGRRVLHAQQRGQLHRHGRDRGGADRSRAVAGVRPLLEQRARLSDGYGRPGPRPEHRRAATEQRFDELVLAAPPEFLPANTDPLGRASVDFEFSAGRIALDASTAQSSPTRRTRGRCATPATPFRHGQPQRPRGTRHRADELADRLALLHPRQGRHGAACSEGSAARSAIRVLTNGVGATDEPLVHWRYSSYRREMLKIGIQLYEVSPTLARDVSLFGIFGLTFRRLHAKVAVFDNQTAVRRLDELRPALGLVEHRVGPADREPARWPTKCQPDGQRAGNAGIYRLRLAADGETIEWWSRGPDGNMHFTIEEPDVTWTLQMQQMLLEPLVAEDLL